MLKFKAFRSRKAVGGCVPEHRDRIRRLMERAAQTDANADSTSGNSLPTATVSTGSTQSRMATPPLPQPNNCSPANIQLAKVLEKFNALSRRVANVERATNSNTTAIQDLQNTVTRMNERVMNVETMTISIHTMLKELCNKQSPKARDRPAYLPFTTTADLLAFNGASDEDYDDLVSYLVYIGGINSTTAAARYLKNCITFDEYLFRNVTWTSSDKKNPDRMAMKDTRFARACFDAMPINKETLAKPTEVEFTFVMTKALKSAKECFRRKLKRPADLALEDDEEPENQPIPNVEPPRQRPRIGDDQQLGVYNHQLQQVNNDEDIYEILEEGFDDGEDDNIHSGRNNADNSIQEDAEDGGDLDVKGSINGDGNHEGAEHDEGAEGYHETQLIVSDDILLA